MAIKQCGSSAGSFLFLSSTKTSFFFFILLSRAKGLFPPNLCRLWHYALAPSLLYYDSLLIISRRRGNIFVFTVAFSISKNPSGLGNGKGIVACFRNFITCSHTMIPWNEDLRFQLACCKSHIIVIRGLSKEVVGSPSSWSQSSCTQEPHKIGHGRWQLEPHKHRCGHRAPGAKLNK